MEGCAFRFLPPAAGPGQFSFPKGLGLTENGPAPSGFRLRWLKKTVATMQAAGCFCEAGLGQGGFFGCTSPLHSYMAAAQALLGSTLRIPVSEPSPCHGPLLSSSLSPWRHEVGIFGLKGFGWSLQQHEASCAATSASTTVETTTVETTTREPILAAELVEAARLWHCAWTLRSTSQLLVKKA